MLMALLYTNDGRIVAASLACDQIPFGDTFWLEYHEADLEKAELFETAYVTIASQELRSRLMLLGIDDSLCGEGLAREVESSALPRFTRGHAA